MITNQTHASKLAAIDHTLSQTYTFSSAALASYYQAAKTLVEAKKTVIIDTRDTAELVEQYNGLSSEHPESIAAVEAAEALLAKVQAEAQANGATQPAFITNLALANQKTTEQTAFEAWVEDQTRSERETLETQIRTQLVEPESVSIGGALLDGAQAGIDYTKGFGAGIWNEIKALKDLLDWKTWWGLLKVIGGLLASLKAAGAAVLENGLGVLDPIATAISQAFETDTEVVKKKLATLKDQTNPYSTGEAVAFVVAALLPIGKLAKVGKLGTAGEKVFTAIETGVRQFKNTLKYLEAHIGQAVKTYRWNEADLAYEAKLADGSTRVVSKADLDGGNTSGGSVKSTATPNFNTNTGTWNVLERYDYELGEYGEEWPQFADKYDANGKLIQRGDTNLTMQKYGLDKVRYDLSDIDVIIDKYKVLYGEYGDTMQIIYVQKADGSLAFSLRPERADYIPHPTLANGGEVKIAGTIKVEMEAGNIKKMVVDNNSGHYQPNARTQGELIEARINETVTKLKTKGWGWEIKSAPISELQPK